MIYDISREIFSSEIYPGDPVPAREFVMTFEKGMGPDVTRLLLKGAKELHEEAAQFLVERGILCVGVESLSVAPLSSPVKVHKLLLGAEMILLEGLVLEEVPEGRYELIALPLKMAELDGSPVRAVLRELSVG